MVQPQRKQAGRFNEPSLPPHVIVNDGGITIQHFYRSGDHGPPHLHLDGGGVSTRIGQNGRPLAGDPPLLPAQQTIIAADHPTRGSQDRPLALVRSSYLNDLTYVKY